MLFMVAAYLKPDFAKELAKFSDDLNEHFAQAGLRIAGALRDADGKRRGYLGFVEEESFEGAESFVKEGPFFQRNLYERIEIFQYEVEVGHLG